VLPEPSIQPACPGARGERPGRVMPVLTQGAARPRGLRTSARELEAPAGTPQGCAPRPLDSGHTSPSGRSPGQVIPGAPWSAFGKWSAGCRSSIQGSTIMTAEAGRDRGYCARDPSVSTVESASPISPGSQHSPGVSARSPTSKVVQVRRQFAPTARWSPPDLCVQSFLRRAIGCM